MVISVKLSGALRRFVDGLDQLDVLMPSGAAPTPLCVLDVLTHVAQQHPRLGKNLLTSEGQLLTYLTVFLNNADIRQLERERSAVAEGDTLSLLPAIAGG